MPESNMLLTAMHLSAIGSGGGEFDLALAPGLNLLSLEHAPRLLRRPEEVVGFLVGPPMGTHRLADVHAQFVSTEGDAFYLDHRYLWDKTVSTVWKKGATGEREVISDEEEPTKEWLAQAIGSGDRDALLARWKAARSSIRCAAFLGAIAQARAAWTGMVDQVKRLLSHIDHHISRTQEGNATLKRGEEAHKQASATGLDKYDLPTVKNNLEQLTRQIAQQESELAATQQQLASVARRAFPAAPLGVFVLGVVLAIVGAVLKGAVGVPLLAGGGLVAVVGGGLFARDFAALRRVENECAALATKEEHLEGSLVRLRTAATDVAKSVNRPDPETALNDIAEYERLCEERNQHFAEAIRQARAISILAARSALPTAASALPRLREELKTLAASDLGRPTVWETSPPKPLPPKPEALTDLPFLMVLEDPGRGLPDFVQPNVQSALEALSVSRQMLVFAGEQAEEEA